MHSISHTFRNTLLVVCCAFSSMAFCQDELPDTTVRIGTLSEDTAIVVEEEPEEIYEDEPTSSISQYFVRKEYQDNGGGPDSLSQQKVPDTVISRFKKDESFWYVNYPFEKETLEPVEQNVPVSQRTWFQTLLWLLIIGGFVAVVIVYLSNSNIGLFSKKNRPIDTPVSEELDTDNIFEINYQREIDKAVAAGNYRFAVRLMFLRLLKSLTNKKLINYKTDRTNFDYLRQLSATKYYQEFFRLTRNYEYAWYGQFEVDSERFTLIRRDFENLDSKLARS